MFAFLFQRSVRRRGSAAVPGPRLPVLRGQRCRESCRSCTGVPGPAQGSEVGAAPTSTADPSKVGRAFCLEGAGHDLRQEHDQGPEKEALVEHMTPSLRPPPRRTWRTRQENGRDRSQQQRLREPLTGNTENGITATKKESKRFFTNVFAISSTRVPDAFAGRWRHRERTLDCKEGKRSPRRSFETEGSPSGRASDARRLAEEWRGRRKRILSKSGLLHAGSARVRLIGERRSTETRLRNRVLLVSRDVCLAFAWDPRVQTFHLVSG